MGRHRGAEERVIGHWRNHWSGMRLVSGPAAANERRLVEIVEAAWRPVGGKSVLEVGCGQGSISVAFAERGAMALCLDSAERAVCHSAARLASLNLHGYGCVGSGFDLPLASDAVDVVASGGLLEHFARDLRLAMLAEMSRVSRGCVVTLVPNGLDPFYRFAKRHLQQTNRWPWGEEHSLRGLSAEFEEAGMTVVHECSYDPQTTVDLVRDAIGLMPDQADALIRWQADEDDDISCGYRLVTIGAVD